MADDLATQALIDEAMRKSWLIWVQTRAATRPIGHPFWHVWLDGVGYLLTGTREQPDPELADGEPITVLARSKDNQHRLITFGATASRVRPPDVDWPPATEALAKARLNLPSAHEAPAMWADSLDVTIYRFEPNGQVYEQPGSYDDASHRQAPVDSVATTARWRPKVLHRRGHHGRPLS
ncbi:MAG: hypothetical protein ACRDPG_01805 [Nocardioidaceae bacterium]